MLISESFFTYNLAYWNILNLSDDTRMKSLFSTNDYMIGIFNNEVKLVESDAIVGFFEKIEKRQLQKNKACCNCSETVNQVQYGYCKWCNITTHRLQIVATLTLHMVEIWKEINLLFPIEQFLPNMLAK
ncbi:hypothetical protein RclHR1_02870012 [Rhizophagus clarus]|uniref:Uncharacterized protein n=1 Tax=Rhizophagus clarus TaxID=94130 RepID=A0A2Z6RFW7_9GLOM|nr:hypothetical protein RclHR1_02870012 [Rhizophagus clarus]